MSFWDNLEQYGTSIALLTPDGSSISYAELSQTADRFAAALGTGRKLLFILCGNHPASVAAYLGALRAKHVPLLLSNRIGAEPLKTLIDTYHPAFVIAPSGLSIDGLQKQIELSDTDSLFCVQDQPECRPLHPDLALLLSTSGSTGSPKLVRLSHKNLQSNTEAIVSYLGIDSQERPITTLPMYYTYGLSVINSHLQAGASILLTDASLMNKEFWEFLKTQSASSLAGVPYTYEMLRRLRFLQMELPSLKTMTQAGGKLPGNRVSEFAQYAREKGIRFFVMYGQTEATARMSYLPPEMNLEKSASIGIPIPGGRFELIDDQGAEISAPQIDGELVYTGPNVMMGYAQCREDLANGDELGGRLSTGDLAQKDADGFYYITGRKKRFLKIFGNRINLDEVELLLRQEGYECACGGTDNQLCVATTSSQDDKIIKEQLSALLGLHPSAFKIIQVPEILKNESGKVQYSKIFQGMQG